MKIQRQAQIRKLVEEKHRVTVDELSRALAVSKATIRRDLDEMNGEAFQRTHGGIVSRISVSAELPIIQRGNENSELKKKIGRAAAALIRPGETLFISSGSTALEVARALPTGMRLTVISNSLPVINILTGRLNIELIAIGGLVRQDELSMIGHTAEIALREFRADHAFMGMRAIHPEIGFTNDYVPEILTDRTILGIASRITVVADHSKFGRVYSVFVAPVTAVNTIVTDVGVNSQAALDIRELGVEVILT
jgi:DeoR/GlpR family transcriptional regulator of sugar metabolism